MLSSAEIARGSRGAIKFLSRDASAPLDFDNTPEACLRSFQVMIVVAPIYALYLIIHYMQVNTVADEGQIALAEGLRYVVDWLMYPVIFYEIARRRGWLAGTHVGAAPACARDGADILADSGGLVRRYSAVACVHRGHTGSRLA